MYQGMSNLAGDTSWLDILNNVVTTAGQVLHPGSPSTLPTYTPGSYSASNIGTSTGPWVLGLGALAVVLLMRKR